MRCSRSLLCSVILFLTLIMFAGMSAFAQDPPEVAMGMSPSATYHGGDSDFVDTATGRLHLHIPLVVDHSQRGNLNFTYSVDYTSTGTWVDVLPSNLIQPPKFGVSSPALLTNGLLSSLIRQQYKDPDTSRLYFSFSVYENVYVVGPAHPMGTTSGSY